MRIWESFTNAIIVVNMTDTRRRIAIAKKKEEEYKFKNGEVVQYRGGLYHMYEGQSCLVKGRSRSDGDNWYDVECSDGYRFPTIECVLVKEELDDRS